MPGESHVQRSLAGCRPWGREESDTTERLTLGFAVSLFRGRAASGASDGRVRLQCRRSGLKPWIRKIPCRRERLPTSVFLPGEFHGQRNLADCIVHGVAKSQTRLSDEHFHFRGSTHPERQEWRHPAHPETCTRRLSVKLPQFRVVSEHLCFILFYFEHSLAIYSLR